MKLRNIIYILSLMLFICCSNKVTEEDDLIEKASLKYLKNNDYFDAASKILATASKILTTRIA